MKLRLHGTPAECAAAAERLRRTPGLHVQDESRPYPDRSGDVAPADLTVPPPPPRPRAPPPPPPQPPPGPGGGGPPSCTANSKAVAMVRAEPGKQARRD